MVIPSEHSEKMSKKLFCILLPHGGKLSVPFANERFKPARFEARLPRGVLWCGVRKRIRGRWRFVSCPQ